MDRSGADSGLETFLAGRDEPCPGCAYNLRGLTGNRCPECNQELQVGLLLAEPRLGALIAAIVGLAVGAGASGVWLVLATVLSMRFGEWPPAAMIVIPTLTLVVEGAMMILLSRKRGRMWFRSLSAGSRGWVVAVSIGGTLAAVMVFLLATLAAF